MVAYYSYKISKDVIIVLVVSNFRYAPNEILRWVNIKDC